MRALRISAVTSMITGRWQIAGVERPPASRSSTPSAWGAQTRSSRRRFVFVNESAEEVASPHLQRINRRCGQRIGSAAAIRGLQIERSVRTLLAEVADVDAEHVLELAAPEDQQSVEALPAHAADQRSA